MVSVVTMATMDFLGNSFFNGCSTSWYKIQQNTLCACVIHKARPPACTLEHLRKCLVHHRFSRFLRTHVKNLTLSVLELDHRATVVKANHSHHISDPVSIKTAQSCHYELVQAPHFNLFTKQRLQENNDSNLQKRHKINSRKTRKNSETFI